MKLAIFSVVVSVAVMGVLAFQAFRQELYLKGLRAHLMETSVEVTKKEEAIMEIKNKIQNVKKELSTLNNNVDAVRKNKEELVKATQELEASLKTCITEKGEAEKKKTEVADSITKFKADHEDAKQKAQWEIQNLKEQILNRDKAICAFADMTNAEARKLCGVSDAEK